MPTIVPPTCNELKYVFIGHSIKLPVLNNLKVGASLNGRELSRHSKLIGVEWPNETHHHNCLLRNAFGRLRERYDLRDSRRAEE